MASEEISLVSAQRLDNGLNSHSHSQLVFQDSFSCGAPAPRRVLASAIGDPGAKATRELTGFIDNHHHHHYFHHHHQAQAADFRRAMFGDDRPEQHPQHHQHDRHNWNNSSRASTTPSGDGSDEEEVDDDDDDDDNEDDNDVEDLVAVGDRNNAVIGDKTNNSADKIGSVQKSKRLPSFGLKEGNMVQSGNERNSEVRYALTVANADGEVSYPQYLQGSEDSNTGNKDAVVENGCGFSGRKESSYTSESGESLRAILSDPLTGVLMDDAMILPCGHSFGSGGIQHVIRLKACCTCSQAVSEESVAPNLSLRAAVRAFRREEEQLNRPSKRRRERYDQDKGVYGDLTAADHSRGRGVQFPFAVTDRVIIKGNKRTPQRFVGREAVVTTQCLNGWYVVKTLDNAESVKLQYRSLAKVSDSLSAKPISSKITPNWLQSCN